MSGVIGLLILLVLPLSLLLGVAALAWSIPRWLRYRRLGRPRLRPIAMQQPGVAAVFGTVRATTAGTLDCPLSGQPAVHVRVAVQLASVSIRYGSTSWVQGLEASSAMPFLIEDEAKDLALVRVDGARFDLEHGHIPVNTRAVQRTPDRVLPFLRERVPPSVYAEFEARLARRTEREVALGFKYEEERIGAGDEVYVFGAASRADNAAFQQEPRRPVLELSAAPDRELLITVTDPVTQLQSFGQALRFGVAALLVGLGLVVYLLLSAA